MMRITHWRSIGLLFLIALVIWGPMMMPASYWYELKEVRIEDSVIGTPPRVGVDRVTYRDFLGTYTARINTFPEGDLICVMGPFTPITYRATDEPLIDKDLAWWLRDIAAFRDCERQGMLAGQFTVETTHVVLNPWRVFPWVQRVTTKPVLSNVFTIFATAVPPVQQLMEQQQQIEELTKQVEETTKPLNQLIRGLIIAPTEDEND